MNRLPIAIALALAFVALPMSADASADSAGEPPPKFGGPDSVPTTIEEDAEEKRPIFETGFLDRYHECKKEFAGRTGVSYGID